MSDAVSIAIVTQIGALLLAGLAAFVSWRTHKAVNGKMEEFKVMFRTLSKAEDIETGRQQEKAEEQERRLNPPLQDMGS